MLRIFRANHVYNFLLVPIVGAILLLRSFLIPDFFVTTKIHLELLFFSADLSEGWAILINYGIVLATCFVLLEINARFNFVKERTFLPSYLFLLLVFAIPKLHPLQPATFASFFILLAIRSLFLSFGPKNAYKSAFDASFLISLAGFFYPQITVLIVLVPISIFILRHKLEWRDFGSALLGLALPWIITFSLFYVFGDTNQLMLSIDEALQHQQYLIWNSLSLQLYIGFMILIIIVSSIFILTQYDEKKISTRRYFKILSFFFFSTLILLILPSVSFEIIMILAIPLSYLITNYLIFMRRRFWAELIFALLMVGSVVVQFFM